MSGTQITLWTPVGQLGGNEVGFPSEFENICKSTSEPDADELGVCEYWFQDGWNYLNIDNEPFNPWVENLYGTGMFTDTITCPAGGCDFDLPEVAIGPDADPSWGYSVSYQYDYCVLPCGDVTFNPTSSQVLPPADFGDYNAIMGGSADWPGADTYYMALYSYDDNTTTPNGTIGSYFVSQWVLVVQD